MHMSHLPKDLITHEDNFHFMLNYFQGHVGTPGSRGAVGPQGPPVSQ